MAQLRYFDHQRAWRTRTLGNDKFIIGRVESCQLAIEDDLVSREHARIDRDPDGRFRLRDLSSRNKTYVNGLQISETLLVDGDMVRVGAHVFEFLDDSLRADLADLSFLTPDRSDPPGTQWLKIKTPVTLPLSKVGDLAVLGSDSGYPARAEDVASAALGRLLLDVGADRGFVALRGESNKELRPVAHRGLGGGPAVARTPVSQTFAYSALLQSVAGRYPQKNGQVDAKAGYASAALVAPLLYRNDVVGIIYVDRPTSGQAFPEAAIQEIAAAGAHLGALMAEVSRQLAAGDGQVGPMWLASLRRMQLAQTVQPTGSRSFDVAVKLMAGRGRCGDFLDVIHLSEDRLIVLVVDAGGHGVWGFMQAAGIRTAVQTALALDKGTRDLAAITSAINRTIKARSARQLVTCTLVDIDPPGGQIRYVNAGGPAPLLLVGPGRLVTLDQPSLVLGIDPNYNYEANSVDLPSSFRLICHTDGLPEMSNAVGEALGTQRVHDLLLEREAFSTPSDIIARIVSACEKHRGTAAADDDALVGVISHG